MWRVSWAPWNALPPKPLDRRGGLVQEAGERRTMRDGRLGYWWLATLAVTLCLVLVSFRWLDVPVALHFAGDLKHLSHRVHVVGEHLGSLLLVAGEAGLAAMLVFYRIMRGSLPSLGKVTVIACATSLCAFALNEFVLKTMFGVQQPLIVLGGAAHVFQPFQGSWESSFPSGHMALAGGFVATFRGQDRRLVLALGAGMILAAVLLIAGGWHFLSDVIAGSFVGGSAGILAAVLWRQHQVQARWTAQ